MREGQGINSIDFILAGQVEVPRALESIPDVFQDRDDVSLQSHPPLASGGSCSASAIESLWGHFFVPKRYLPQANPSEDSQGEKRPAGYRRHPPSFP